MALVLKDRVLETCTSPGTGTITLLGAVTGYQAFSTVGNGNTCYYAIADQNGANWECGIGTYSSGTLARTTVLSSSNAGSLTNFSTGSQNVFLTYPSERSVNLSSAALTSGRVTFATTDGLLTDSANFIYDANGNLIVGGTTAANSASGRGNITLNGTASTIIDFTQSGVNKGFIYHDYTNIEIQNSVAGALLFSTNATERMRITSAGNVGIGTSSPSAMLDITAASGGYANIKLTQTSVVTWALENTATSGLFQIIQAGVASRLTLDTSGNLGLGVTPSAWASGTEGALQVKNGSIYAYSTYETGFSVNAYYNAGWKYISSSAAAAQYKQTNGEHQWLSAPSGTAGNAITFTQAMTLDADGDLGIGATNPLAKLHVKGSGTSGQVSASFILENSSSGTGGMDITGSAGASRWRFLYGGGPSTGTNALTEAMCILTEGASAGNVGIGTSSPTNKLDVIGGVKAGSSTVYAEWFADALGSYFENTGTSATTRAIRLQAQDGSNNYAQIFVQGGSNYVSFATNTTERMRINSSGNVGIGTTSPAAKLHIAVADASVDGTKGVRITNPAGTQVVLECGVSSDSFVGTTSGSSFSIRTNNTERMRITYDGNVLINASGTDPYTTNGGYGIALNSDKYVAVARSNGASLYLARQDSDGDLTEWWRGGSKVGTISVTGSATAYNTSSDYRLKENIAPMTGALAKVVQLKPVTYKWKVDGSDGQGFIAHELAEVVPDCVTGEKDAVNADGKPIHQGVDTSFLVATLTAAIQEQQALIESLTTRLTALENK